MEKYIHHIHVLKINLTKFISVYSKIREILFEKLLKVIHFGRVQLVILYGKVIACWRGRGGTYKSFIDQLLTVQKLILKLPSKTQAPNKLTCSRIRTFIRTPIIIRHLNSIILHTYMNTLLEPIDRVTVGLQVPKVGEHVKQTVCIQYLRKLRLVIWAID